VFIRAAVVSYLQDVEGTWQKRGRESSSDQIIEALLNYKASAASDECLEQIAEAESLLSLQAKSWLW